MAFLTPITDKCFTSAESPSRVQSPTSSIVIVGHAYPAPEDLVYVDEYMRSNQIDALLLAGDFSGENDVLDKLKKPRPYEIYASPGNHEIYDQQSYETFVATWGNFRQIDSGPVTFIILNSEDCPDKIYPHGGCGIQGEQLELLQSIGAAGLPDSRHVIVLIHHVLWYRDLDQVSKLLLTHQNKTLSFETLTNSDGIKKKLLSLLTMGVRTAPLMDSRAENEWWNNTHPILSGLPQNVLVFGGDTAFNSHLAVDNVHYFHTGLRSKQAAFADNIEDLQEFFRVDFYAETVVVRHITFPRQQVEVSSAETSDN